MWGFAVITSLPTFDLITIHRSRAMTFLLILVLATLAVAGHARIRFGAVRWRRAAHYGLGIAFVAAGVSHLVNTTPFKQHLPEWVPAATSIVVVSGIAEIVLGFALVAARRSAPVVGIAAAVFLVSVFPANVYVAVAGVDVDGLPRGLYPWLRLPLQAVFVVWALASTRPIRDRAEMEPDGPFGLMPGLPPRHGPDRDRTGAASTVQGSVLQLRRFRDVPAFMAAALRLQGAFADSPGAIEMSLRAAPLRRTFWTLSQWRSDADLRGFVAHAAHVDVMRRFRPAMRSSNFITWHTADDHRPTWTDAAVRLATDGQPTDGHPVQQRIRT
jgi:uncharacterized membrane protein